MGFENKKTKTLQQPIAQKCTYQKKTQVYCRHLGAATVVLETDADALRCGNVASSSAWMWAMKSCRQKFVMQNVFRFCLLQTSHKACNVTFPHPRRGVVTFQKADCSAQWQDILHAQPLSIPAVPSR